MVAHTYDANKNITSEDRGTAGSSADDFSFNRTVDAKDRLTNWLRDNGDAQNWSLSLEGDWNQTDGSIAASGGAFDQARTHNAPHEILTIDPDNAGPLTPVTINHDPKGNLTQDNTGLQLTFDFDNHLQQVVVSATATRGTPGTHTYEYDALGRRVTKNTDTDADGVPDHEVCFIYAGQQVLAEYKCAGNSTPKLERKYVYCSTGYIDEPLALIDVHNNGSEHTYYYHRDRSYNVIGLTDDTGAIVELYTYTLYGERQIYSATWTALTTSAYDNHRGFQGLRHDEETGLIENRARVLDPITGRFVQRDPLGYPDGLNTYAAYHVMHGGVDPSGMWEEIDRQGQSRADSISDDGVNLISTLAEMANHDASEVSKWIDFDGTTLEVIDANGQRQRRTKAQLQATDEVCPGQRVTVPNTVVGIMGYVGDSGS